MTRLERVLLATILVLPVTAAQPAFGRDPYRDDPDALAPGQVAWAPEPAPAAPPPGVYLVTETYVGDSVTRIGALTTYSTDTIHEATGSYARVLDSVGTGASSRYDGASFNGRASLTDGRSVAGTYYENYIRAEGGFIPVSVVFFQDDSEFARTSRAAAPPLVPPTREPAAAPAPVAVWRPGPTGAVTPIVDPGDAVPRAPTPPAARGSALLPDRSIEVLRGRRTAITFSGGDVRAWRFVSGEAVPLSALTGNAGDAFVARWDRLAPPTAAWLLRFLVQYADGTSHELVVRVAVRAPALVE